MTDVRVHGVVTLPCNTLPNSTVVWQYQQCCDNFEDGVYFCAIQTDVAVGNQYQIRRKEPGENSLLINDVTKDMTGLYTCKDRDHDKVHYRVLLNVISKYNSVLLFFFILHIFV